MYVQSAVKCIYNLSTLCNAVGRCLTTDSAERYFEAQGGRKCIRVLGELALVVIQYDSNFKVIQ
jgi:hypothetical protein